MRLSILLSAGIAASMTLMLLSPTLQAGTVELTNSITYWLNPAANPQHIAEQAKRRQQKMAAVVDSFFCTPSTSARECDAIHNEINELSQALKQKASAVERAALMFAKSQLTQRLSPPVVVTSALLDTFEPTPEMLASQIIKQQAAIQSLKSMGFTIPDAVDEAIIRDLNLLAQNDRYNN